MAEYKISYTSNGEVKHELIYKGKVFDYTMKPTKNGKESDKQAFDHQVNKYLPNEKEEVYESLAELSFADDSEIEDILKLLTDNEKS